MLYMIVLPLALALLAFAAIALEYHYALKTTRPGPYELTCPADGSKVLGEIDPRRAARTAAIGFPYHLRLSDCGHWPERSGCDQRCIKRIAQGYMFGTAEPKIT